MGQFLQTKQEIRGQQKSFEDFSSLRPSLANSVRLSYR